MKVTSKQMTGELSRPALFLLHYGRMYGITAIATTMDEANAHMLANPGSGALAEHEGFVFIAQKSDAGAPSAECVTLLDAIQTFITRVESASPPELRHAIAINEAISKDMGRSGSVRALARRMASMLSKVK